MCFDTRGPDLHGPHLTPRGAEVGAGAWKTCMMSLAYPDQAATALPPRGVCGGLRRAKRRCDRWLPSCSGKSLGLQELVCDGIVSCADSLLMKSVCRFSRR